MALTTYTELKTAVANWLNRSDLTARIPEFVDLAEVRIKRVVRSKHTALTTANIAAGDGSVALPTGLIDVGSVSISTTDHQQPLRFISYPELLIHRRQHATNAPPDVAAIVGTTLYFSPLADDAYVLTFEAQAAFTSLRSAATNWVLDNHPDLYLFGSLAESAPYLKDDERIAVWEGRFQMAVQEVDAARDRTLYPRPVRAVPQTFAF